MSRNRPITYIAIIAAFIFFYSYLLFPSSSSRPASPYNSPEQSSSSWKGKGDGLSDSSGGGGVFRTPPMNAPGEVIMPKLGNETIKQELGRASWKLLHTMLARFPEKPTMDEREALKSYLYLFGRLYPCGECATHFRLLLQKYPPQTSSRDAASQWGCVVHNVVNERLRKPIFDCGTIADKYHCGCAEEDEKKRKLEEEGKAEGSGSELVEKQKVVDRDGEEEGEMKLVKEGLTRGG
ncbi:hypothetical protein EYR41_002849 [Orbilia oligospora]|uniref:Sulfhydryl oxidase n=1 Tax=Orbilia oligospora TaxID=2813651 RepID=A0A7C8P3I1_ORBOL|nr:hypothetical protein TWF751_000789 [Orbilia oligospora]TGJ70829.1 hypothetical protein EYR41_002849 [Orbilia oligospora]